MADYKPLATQVAKRYGIPPKLLHGLIQQESGWNPNAHNPSGATGIMQIHLPSHPNISDAQARNPRFAIEWGAKYLKSNFDRFGSWKLALAAYNAGPGNVENGKWQSFPETRNYVKSVLGYAGTVATPKASASKASPTGSPLLPSTPSVGAVPIPTPGDLTGFALSNLATMSSGGKPYDPVEALTSLTMGVAQQAQAPAIPEFIAPSPTPTPSQPRRPSTGSHDVKGFVPAFQKALNRLLADTGLTINSGYRSPERQAELFAAAVKKYGSEAAARKWVAPPGKSKHNHGVAADLGGDLSVLSDSMLKKYGLYRPMSYEPWHVELIGSRG